MSIQYWLNKQKFLPGTFGLLINPFYILRHGLFKFISCHSKKISGKVLDIGCGSKPYISCFTESTQYIGTDILYGTHNHKDSKIDVFYDGRILPFRDSEFNAIVCFELIEHVFNLEQLLNEINRTLKDDGYLLITIPFAWNEHEAPHDYARYTSFGITKLLEEKGFLILDLKKSNSFILAIGQLIITYIWQNLTLKNNFQKAFVQLFFSLPFTLLLLLLDKVLPKDYSYYSNLIILSKKHKCLTS